MEIDITMVTSVITDSYNQQKNALIDLPEQVQIALGTIMDDLAKGKTQVKAPKNSADRIGQLSYGNPYCNVIPSITKSTCMPLLITYCYDADNFEGRIMESLDHAVLHCPGDCRIVYILTTQWVSQIANKMSGYIESVRNNGVRIQFVHITAKGIVAMPV